MEIGTYGFLVGIAYGSLMTLGLQVLVRQLLTNTHPGRTVVRKFRAVTLAIKKG